MLIPKPGGSLAAPSAHRDIWLADQPAKAQAGRLRKRLSSIMRPTVVNTQHGAGFGGRGCDMAHLFVRLMGDIAHTQKLSTAVCFIDVQCAFASAMRELALPVASDGEFSWIESFLRAKGL